MFNKSFVVAALTLASLTSFAADRFSEVSLQEGQTSGLGTCGGSATVKRVYGTLTLLVSDAKSCSNVKIDGRKVGKMPDGQGTVAISLNEHVGANRFQVEASSNSGKTGTLIDVSSYRQPARRSNDVSPYTPADFSLSTGIFGLKSASLESCGGEVSIAGNNGSTTLYFSGIQNCSNFDILTADGRSINFPNQHIGQGSSSVRLPSVDGSTVKVVVKSNTGKTYDVFRVNYNILF